MIHFEDFTVGETRDFGSHCVSREEILAFARRFDAQDFHVDEEAAKASFAGGLIGSGWHSCALMMRLMSEGYMLESASRGAPGIEQLRWLRPLRPGDTVTLRRHVLEKKESRSRPEMGLVHVRHELIDQHGKVATEQSNWIMFGRTGHDHGIEPTRVEAPALYVPPANARQPAPPREPPPKPAYFDDIPLGQITHMGGFEFTAEEIIAFARCFDPQIFHVDADAAKRSAFRGLCASGWHTAAVWMMLMVETWKRTDAVPFAGPRPKLGTSPGFTKLRWLKPVYAGDRLSYTSTVVDKRPSASRPGWGLVHHHNVAANQHGDDVFSFNGCVFWERRPG